MRRALTSIFVLLACLAPTLAACDSNLALKNGRPRVTWVAVEAMVDGDLACPSSRCARLTIWVADIEGDAVDVTASWQGGGQSGDVALAAGSYPLRGLETRTNQNGTEGTPHLVIWDLADVPAGAVVLDLTVDDRPYDTSPGDAYQTPSIDPRTDVSPVAATRQ